MPAISHQKNIANSIFLALLIISCWSTVSFADDLNDAQSPNAADSNSTTFKLMDIEAMNAYQQERRDKLIESLALSSLSTEHQELLANAMAKIYVGIPVSSYTHTIRANSRDQEPIDSSQNSVVSADGHIKKTNSAYTQSLDADSPFVYFPPAPFASETGSLLEESKSLAKFGFDLDLPMERESEDDMLSEMSEKMKWVIEITVNKADHAPESIVLKLDKPVRKRFLFKLTTLRVEFHYSFIESCSCFAVSRLSTEMKGSAIIVGRLDETSEKTYDDINCEQPLQFLLPETRNSGVLTF